MSCAATSSNWLGIDTAFCPSARLALATRRYSPDETVGRALTQARARSRTTLPLSMNARCRRGRRLGRLTV